MTRVNKKSRIKGLPPKLLLQTKDALTGSYPGKFRTASDGKNGSYNIFFDDTKTVNFVTGAINLGSGVSVRSFPSGSHFNVSGAYNSSYVELGQDMSSSLTVSASIRKGIADAYLSFNNPLADSFEPFKEHMHVDAKITANSANKFTGSYLQDFYNNGSETNEVSDIGFGQPLSAKTKIVIDLTPKVAHSVAIRNFTSQSNNHPMCYWNKDLKVWEGIGTGKEFSHADYIYHSNSPITTVKTAYENLFNEQTIGFAPTSLLGNDIQTQQNAPPSLIKSLLPKNAGMPINNFLFPVDVKFEASSSNLITMSSYINQPFLLEKIILEISLSFQTNRTHGTWDTGSPTTSFRGSNPDFNICTFFILNQTNKVKESFSEETTIYSGSATTISNISYATSESLNNTIRELVTWGDISSFNTTAYTANDGLRLISSGSVTFGSSSIISSYERGEYFDNDGISLYNYTNGFSDALAYKIIGGQGRELNLEYTNTYDPSAYKILHPEFDATTGPPGLSGQSSTGPVGYFGWTKNLSIPIKCKSPMIKNNLYDMYTYGYASNQIQSSTATPSITHGFLLKNSKAGRRFNNKSTRELKNPLRDPGFPPLEPTGDSSNNAKIRFHNGNNNSDQILYGYTERYVITPYLLLPTDNLIFGWQLPITPCLVQDKLEGVANIMNSYHTLGPELTFAPHISKITLYGSYIKEGVEHHDTLEQHLTSENIHEVIE